MSLLQKSIRSTLKQLNTIGNVTKSNNVIMKKMQHNDANKDVVNQSNESGSSAQQTHTPSPTITSININWIGYNNFLFIFFYHIEIKLTKLDKYLVQKYSSANYKTIDEVPDLLSSTQVNFARDKGRAKMSIILIFLTVFGALFTINLAKYLKKQGKSTWSEDMNKKHAEYSKMHQDAIRNTHKN